MANEVRVYEMTEIRAHGQARPVPLIAKQILSVGGASSNAFNRSTNLITVTTTLACWVDITASPLQAGKTIYLAADREYDFSVQPGHSIRAFAAEA